MTTEQTAAAKKNAAIFLAVAQQMTKAGVAALPRNYELFYEALSGQKPELVQDLNELGTQPSQLALDALGVRHRLVGQNAMAAERSRLDIAAMLGEISGHLDALFERKQGYAEMIEKLTRGMDGTAAAGEMPLELGLLKTLLSDVLLHEKNSILRLQSGLENLHKLRGSVDAERRANIIDPMTGMPNKAAFSARLTGLFEDSASRHRTVLMLIELSSLRALTQQVGQELANRIVRRFGVILRKSVKKNDFVARIGDQEFALLFDDVTHDNVRSIAYRLHDTVEAKLLPRKDGKRPANILRMTMGIAGCDDAATPNEFFTKAETTLVSARNQAEPRIALHAGAAGKTAGKSAKAG
ncbi:GGDEF domain-containing protein [Pararhizobium sp.]|uniref:GGDEF domain-containing protein n=1 Tax=Pararhizobium sp. TaxID=1977563 RepID=UPI00271665BC|nr:diguanylate cyclase [Pararhizobium sp.]MDO9417582.1 diguanylate cyclase [Pararhizobium sp.]